MSRYPPTTPKTSKLIKRAQDREEAPEASQEDTPVQAVLDGLAKGITPQPEGIALFDDHLSENGVSNGTTWEDFEL